MIIVVHKVYDIYDKKYRYTYFKKPKKIKINNIKDTYERNRCST